ncbi:hypothetical protein GGH91_005784, partial [Coemansia sp. RSA 2671]
KKAPGAEGASSRSSPASSSSSSSSSLNVAPAQRLAEVVAGILAHEQPVYPPTMPPAAHRASNPAVAMPSHEMAQGHAASSASPPPHVGFHYMPHHHAMAMNPAAMSYPAVAGYGGMVAGSYYMDPLAGGIPPGGFFGVDYGAGNGGQRPSAMPYYPYANIAHYPPSSCSPSDGKK